MPPLKPSDREIKNRASRGVIDYCMDKQGFNDEKLAKYIHCAPCTVWRRRDNPEKLTIKEIRAMAKPLKMTEELLLELVGADLCKD